MGTLDGAVWFWLAALLFWRVTCGATLDVPHGLLARARHDAADAALVDALARRGVALRRPASGGAVALTAFTLAFIAVYAGATRSPLGGALLCLLAPAALLGLWQGRMARRLAGAPPAALRRGLDHLRLTGFGVAALSLSLAALWRGVVQQGAALDMWRAWP